MIDHRDETLRALLTSAGSAAAPVAITPMTGRGFTDEVSRVDLDDGRRVVLRRWSPPRAPEHPRAAFLAGHDVPAPRLLAADRHASLAQFVPGRLLGDLIEDGLDDDDAWAAVGAAYRRVHAVTFPSGLAGTVEPDRIVLRAHDPVERAHATLTAAVPGLERRCGDVVAHLPAVHTRVERCAAWLRAAPSTLRHGDVNMWNVLVDGDVGGTSAVPIDWDLPEVGDPAMEVALLDKHASLFTGPNLRRGLGQGLGRGFTRGYGPLAEPRTSLHRIVETVSWVGSDDWDEFASDPDLPAELRGRAGGWLATLVAWLRELPRHLDRLDTLIARSRGSGVSDARGGA